MKRNKVRRKGRSDGEMPCRTAADAGSGTTDRGGVHHNSKKGWDKFSKEFLYKQEFGDSIGEYKINWVIIKSKTGGKRTKIRQSVFIRFCQIFSLYINDTASGKYEETDRCRAYIVTDKPKKAPIFKESSILLLKAHGMKMKVDGGLNIREADIRAIRGRIYLPDLFFMIKRYLNISF